MNAEDIAFIGIPIFKLNKVYQKLKINNNSVNSCPISKIQKLLKNIGLDKSNDVKIIHIVRIIPKRSIDVYFYKS